MIKKRKVRKRVYPETDVKYDNEEQLSYLDSNNLDVELYIDDKFRGVIKVWKDSEMDNREYIIIHDTIIYLDTLRKREA